MRKIILASFVFTTMLFSCTFKKGETPETTNQSTPCTADTVIHLVDVTIADNSFTPAHLDIIAGDTVKWSYSGSSAHTSTCDGTGGTTLPSGGTTWDSGTLLAGNSFKKAITVPGNYTYMCTVHGSAMQGTIVVKPRCQ